MIIELRRKSQITIPKEIVDELKLQEGDTLDIFTEDEKIMIEPVAVYSRSYVKRLESTVMKLNEDPSKFMEGPFKTIEEVMDYLENNNKVNDKIENK